MKKNKNQVDESRKAQAFERKVFQTLVETGNIIPETEAEVRLAEDRLNEDAEKLPENLLNPKAVLDRIRRKETSIASKVIPMPSDEFSEVAEELSRAARKGNSITAEIEEKLRRNRLKADEGERSNRNK